MRRRVHAQLQRRWYLTAAATALIWMLTAGAAGTPAQAGDVSPSSPGRDAEPYHTFTSDPPPGAPPPYTARTRSLDAPRAMAPMAPIFLPVPAVKQSHNLDCEAASLSSALQYKGLPLNQDQVFAAMPNDRTPVQAQNGWPVHWGDPYNAFIGNVDGSQGPALTGYGIYFPAAGATAARLGAEVNAHNGWSFAELVNSIAAGNPVVVWVSWHLLPVYVTSYVAYDGNRVWFSRSAHAQVFVGYDQAQQTITLMDPWDGDFQTYPQALFMSRFDAFGDAGVAITGKTPPPSAPTNLSAVPGPSSATLQWTGTTPASDGYTVGVYSNGVPIRQVNDPSPAPGFVVTGLNDGQAYSFAVAGIDVAGAGPFSLSNAVTPSAPPPGPYNAVVPYRLVDTRPGSGMLAAGAALGAGQSLTAQASGSGGPGGVPPTGVTAVVLNLTAVDPTATGYLVAYPGAGAVPPVASNLNLVPGRTAATLVEVAVDSQGEVSIFNSAGTTDVVVDVEGWVGSGGTSPASYTPMPPTRIADTRSGSGLPGQGVMLGAGSVATIGATGGDGAAKGALAVVVNVTVTDTATAGYLTVWPSGTPRPLASNLNWSRGQTVANRAVVPVGADGTVSIYNYTGTADVVVDETGWFAAAGSAPQGGLFTPMTPARMVDTRPGSGVAGDGTTLSGRSSMTVQVAGVSGVPAMTSTRPPTAVVLTVTVTDTSAPGFLTLWPSTAAQPSTSDVNWEAGETAPNLVIATLDPAGRVSVLTSAGQTDVILDVVGWYS